MLEYKFTKGDRVVVLPTAQNCFAPAGATGTFNEYDSIRAWFYIDDEYVVSDTKNVCIEEYDIDLIKQSKATPQEPQSNEEDIVVDVTPKSVVEDVGSTATNKPVKSDGGSSDYYKISVKTSHGMANVEVNDVIYAMVGGDFDLANVLKACRRMYLASKGCGKEGVDIDYDVNKCKWFLDDFQMRFGKEE